MNHVFTGFIVVWIAVLALTACGKGPSKAEARDAIADAFNTSTKYRTRSDRVTIHDLKTGGEGTVDATVLGPGKDISSVMSVEAKQGRHYVAVATMTTMIPVSGVASVEGDEVGAIFALFPSGKAWRAVPLSKFHKVKKPSGEK